MERFIDGACVRTLKETDINVYMQEWFFELYQDIKEEKEKLLIQNTTLRQISNDSFSDNIETTIKKILSHKKLKNVLQGSQDRDLFYTYVHGLKLLPAYDRRIVEDYISSYIS